MSIRVLFVQPLLAPYLIPRYQALAESGSLEVHIALEAEKFIERPGWMPKPIPKCHIHILDSYLKTKTFAVKDKGFKESYTKAVPYGLVTTIKKVKPHMVIVCNPTEFIFALIAHATDGFLLGLILEDTPVSEQRKSSLVKWLRKRIYRFADFAFCFSKDAEIYARDIGFAGNLLRSSWSISPEWMNSKNDEGVYRQVHTKAELQSPIQFLYVGAFSERKGVMLLLRAWRKFTESNTAVKLVLLGDGSLREQMEKYCAEHGITNVIMPGHLPYDDTKQLYLSSNVFILPTMEDLFGLVVTEAMAFGLPVLTTIYTGARELVKEGENGYIFDPLDNQAIVKSLEKMVERRSELSRMGQISRNIISHYTHQKVMSRMERDICRVYEEGYSKYWKKD